MRTTVHVVESMSSVQSAHWAVSPHAFPLRPVRTAPETPADSGRAGGDAELVALRVGHHHVVPVGTPRTEPPAFTSRSDSALIRAHRSSGPPCPGTRTSMWRRFSPPSAGNLEDGQAGADAVGIAEPRAVVRGVVLRKVELREPLLAGGEGSRQSSSMYPSAVFQNSARSFASAQSRVRWILAAMTGPYCAPLTIRPYGSYRPSGT